MSERTEYPPGVPCWVDTLQPNVDAALAFYGKLFEWDFAGPGAMPDGGKYFVARVRDRDVAGVASLPSGAPPAAVWSTYIAVANVDETTEKAQHAGATIVAPPCDVPPAGRLAVLTDPAGATFALWEAKDRKGAQRVNEPRAWAMSALMSHDVQTSGAFYENVFGWESMSFDAGGGRSATLFRRPGYIGGEPQQPVPRDVVAAMQDVSDRSPSEVPPHWSVDFWVDDTKKIAAQAAALGGAVIVPPHQAAAFLRAHIADPQGAVFTVSQLLA